ncbi:hypothetical protein BHYA_0151g00110 [Botrytis hyacinthi]|uniref:Uncharacterized protein n=1 Tax=Botrytis hyacinthi TaxID=278943 RepID=A0A4Z1GHG5_9HELO|nr:hypothetical protein BHYA_0151g00110 [Botrytis hyacinthi]
MTRAAAQHMQLVPSYQDINVPPKSDGSYCSLEEQLPISDYVGETASAHVASTTLDVTEESNAMDLEQLPFSWDNDVHGSLGLTRLLQRLEIEASMPPLNLDDEVVDTKQFISGNELRNDIEIHATPVKQMSIFYRCVEYGFMPNTVVQHVPIPGKGIHWSPLFELDLFPASQNTRGYRRVMALAPSSSPLIDVKTLPDHNPAIILSLENLKHLNKQRMESCSSLHRQLLAARLKESCPNNYKIMEVYLEIVLELLSEGKYPDATYLSQSLRKAIQKSQLSSEHPFHIRLSYLEVYILYMDGQYAEAELIIRPVIQNLLNNQNLDRSHSMTSDALTLLAFLIEMTNGDSYSKIEKLHRYKIHQVGKYGQSLGNTYFDSMYNLIDILLEDQRIEEAHDLCAHIMEYVELALGCVLQECESFGQAIVIYKICLWIEVEQQGWSDLAGLRVICGGLGSCYEELSQFQDALFLYENLLDKVKDTTRDEDPFIKIVEGRISRVQERMEESSASSEDDGSGDTDSSLEVQMGGVDDKVGYRQFSDNIVHDFNEAFLEYTEETQNHL